MLVEWNPVFLVMTTSAFSFWSTVLWPFFGLLLPLRPAVPFVLCPSLNYLSPQFTIKMDKCLDVVTFFCFFLFTFINQSICSPRGGTVLPWSRSIMVASSCSSVRLKKKRKKSFCFLSPRSAIQSPDITTPLSDVLIARTGRCRRDVLCDLEEADMKVGESLHLLMDNPIITVG